MLNQLLLDRCCNIYLKLSFQHLLIILSILVGEQRPEIPRSEQNSSCIRSRTYVLVLARVARSGRNSLSLSLSLCFSVSLCYSVAGSHRAAVLSKYLEPSPLPRCSGFLARPVVTLQRQLTPTHSRDPHYVSVKYYF